MTSTVRALVTGSTGFVGRHLMPELERQGVHAVTVRRELAPETDWLDALVGVHAVVHLAAAAHERAQIHERARDDEALRRINALATERLARDAVRAGVRHFVFLSTIGVCGDETFGAPFTEESAAAPRSLYAASKLEAENLLSDLSRTTGLQVTVLRPTLVYGPGNPGNFLRLLKLVHRGWPLPFAAVRNRRSLTYVGNLVSAITAVLERTGRCETFVVCDATSVSIAYLVRCLAAGMGRAPRLFPFPAGVLHAAARLAGQEDQLRRLIGSLEADCGKLSRVVGWQPSFDTEHGLRETAVWFRSGYCSQGSG